jgi:hypothetical protein
LPATALEEAHLTLTQYAADGFIELRRRDRALLHEPGVLGKTLLAIPCRVRAESAPRGVAAVLREAHGQVPDTHGVAHYEAGESLPSGVSVGASRWPAGVVEVHVGA